MWSKLKKITFNLTEFVTNEKWSHFHSFLLVLIILSGAVFGLSRIGDDKSTKNQETKNKEKPPPKVIHNPECLSEGQIFYTKDKNSFITLTNRGTQRVGKFYNGHVPDKSLDNYETEFLEKALNNKLDCTLDKMTIQFGKKINAPKKFNDIETQVLALRFVYSDSFDLDYAVYLGNILKPDYFVIENGTDIEYNDICGLELKADAIVYLGKINRKYSEIGC